MASFALGQPLLATGAAWMGSVLPDVVDQKRAAFSFFRQSKFNKIHRRSSHWFGWWLILWLFSQTGTLGPLPDAIVGGLALGAFTHCLLDMCTSHGVPLMPFADKRFSLKICSTGGFVEYTILVLSIALFWMTERHSLDLWTIPLY